MSATRFIRRRGSFFARMIPLLTVVAGTLSIVSLLGSALAHDDEDADSPSGHAARSAHAPTAALPPFTASLPSVPAAAPARESAGATPSGSDHDPAPAPAAPIED